MCKTVRTLTIIAFAVLLVAGAGCGRSSRYRTNRTPVSGSVTSAGQPVKAGKIAFRPVSGGQTFNDTIYNGRYSVHTSRYLMTPGQYDVTIEYSSAENSRGGYDRHHTERVTVGGFGRDYIDFRVK